MRGDDRTDPDWDEYFGDADASEALDASFADGDAVFTLADVARSMRRGVRMGFACGCDLAQELADDDMEKREVVERPDVMRRLREGAERWTRFVDEHFVD